MIDRLVFNVENSTLSNSNVLDVLKHTPGVLVYDGKITIKNSTPIVYINNRKVHLSSSEVLQLLEGTSATNIKSIEVITNPPAKYEAEGGAVLNIVTSKNIAAGYNGSIFSNYKQGAKFPKFSFGTSHFFKIKKLNTYLNYNISPRKDYMHNTEFVNFLDTSNWKTDFKRISTAKNQNVNANIDYEINGNNSISFSTMLLKSPRDSTKKTSNSTTEISNSQGVLDSLFNTHNRKVDETFNLAFTLDYLHKFKRVGEQLSISVHHTNYDFTSFQNVDSGYFLPNNDIAYRNNTFQTFSSQKIQLYTGQADYELPINDVTQFDAGFKISNINSENIVNQFTFDNDEKQEDLENSDIFLYDESNYSAYVTYCKEWDHWNFKSGLRFEYTDVKGNSLSTNKIDNTSYGKFFPSLYIVNKLDDNNEVYLKYNRRIRRPRYSQLNPFKYFLNDNTYIIGDPKLKPQIDDIFTLGYTLNKKHTFEVYYRNENNPTLQFIFQDNINNQIIYKNTNTDVSVSYGLDFTTYTKIANNWSLYVLSSIYYYNNKFFALDSMSLHTADKWTAYGEITNYFTFLKDKSLTADLSYLYISGINDGPTDTSSISGMYINFKKSLWNNRASLSIGVTDVFNTQNYTTSTKYLNQDAFSIYRTENRMFKLGFSYKFGNFNLKSNKKAIDLEERNRLDTKK